MSSHQGNVRWRLDYGLSLANGADIYNAKYFKMSADQGNRDCQEIYASFLWRVNRNPIESWRYWKMLADGRNPGGQGRLRVGLERGTGAEENLTEAARYFKIFAAHEHPHQ
jgi:TPR repeat protein